MFGGSKGIAKAVAKSKMCSATFKKSFASCKNDLVCVRDAITTWLTTKSKAAKSWKKDLVEAASKLKLATELELNAKRMLDAEG